MTLTTQRNEQRLPHHRPRVRSHRWASSSPFSLTDTTTVYCCCCCCCCCGRQDERTWPLAEEPPATTSERGRCGAAAAASTVGGGSSGSSMCFGCLSGVAAVVGREPAVATDSSPPSACVAHPHTGDAVIAAAMSGRLAPNHRDQLVITASSLPNGRLWETPQATPSTHVLIPPPSSSRGDGGATSAAELSRAPSVVLLPGVCMVSLQRLSELAGSTAGRTTAAAATASQSLKAGEKNEFSALRGLNCGVVPSTIKANREELIHQVELSNQAVVTNQSAERYRAVSAKLAQNIIRSRASKMIMAPPSLSLSPPLSSPSWGWWWWWWLPSLQLPQSLSLRSAMAGSRNRHSCECSANSSCDCNSSRSNCSGLNSCGCGLENFVRKSPQGANYAPRHFASFEQASRLNYTSIPALQVASASSNSECISSSNECISSNSECISSNSKCISSNSECIIIRSSSINGANCETQLVPAGHGDVHQEAAGSRPRCHEVMGSIARHIDVCNVDHKAERHSNRTAGSKATNVAIDNSRAENKLGCCRRRYRRGSHSNGLCLNQKHSDDDRTPTPAACATVALSAPALTALACERFPLVSRTFPPIGGCHLPSSTAVLTCTSVAGASTRLSVLSSLGGVHRRVTSSTQRNGLAAAANTDRPGLQLAPASSCGQRTSQAALGGACRRAARGCRMVGRGDDDVSLNAANQDRCQLQDCRCVLPAMGVSVITASFTVSEVSEVAVAAAPVAVSASSTGVTTAVTASSMVACGVCGSGRSRRRVSPSFTNDGRCEGWQPEVTDTNANSASKKVHDADPASVVAGAVATSVEVYDVHPASVKVYDAGSASVKVSDIGYVSVKVCEAAGAQHSNSATCARSQRCGLSRSSPLAAVAEAAEAAKKAAKYDSAWRSPVVAQARSTAAQPLLLLAAESLSQPSSLRRRPGPDRHRRRHQQPPCDLVLPQLALFFQRLSPLLLLLPLLLVPLLALLSASVVATTAAAAAGTATTMTPTATAGAADGSTLVGAVAATDGAAVPAGAAAAAAMSASASATTPSTGQAIAVGETQLESSHAVDVAGPPFEGGGRGARHVGDLNDLEGDDSYVVADTDDDLLHHGKWSTASVVTEMRGAVNMAEEFTDVREIGPDGYQICPTMEIRNRASNFEHLRNCSVIEGHLIIAVVSFDEAANGGSVPAETDERFSFPELREITGSLLVFRSQMTTLGHLFPNLAVIRGQALFRHYSLIVFENPRLTTLGLRSLSRVVRGSVRIEQNQRLCHVDNVDWSLITSRTATHVLRRNQEPALCPKCEPECPQDRRPAGGRYLCWSLGICQKVCSCVDEDQSCTDDGQCCERECLGGCSTPNGTRDCHVCRNFNFNGKCVDRCPANTYQLNGRRCVSEQQCQAYRNNRSNGHYKAVMGMCVRTCPPGYTEKKNETSICVKCKGTCPRLCAIRRKISSTLEAQKYRDCTVFNGSLIIEINSGGNVSGELATYFGQVEEITGYLKISRTPALVSFGFLKNLRVIRGRQLQHNYSVLVHDNANLQEIWDWEERPAFRIESGKLYFHHNQKLCFEKIEMLHNRSAYAHQPLQEQDVSRVTNGDRMPCDVIALSLRAVRNGTAFVDLEWDNHIVESHLADHRHLHAYTIFYMKAPLGKSVTPFDGRDACGSDAWLIRDTYSDGVLPEDNMTYRLRKLDPYARYAIYVKTEVVSDSHITAQSDIIYAQTKMGVPEAPRRIYIDSKGPHTMHLRWDPPFKPNGDIEWYLVVIELQLIDSNYLFYRDPCESDASERLKATVAKPALADRNASATAAAPAAAATAETGTDGAGQCSRCNCSGAGVDVANRGGTSSNNRGASRLSIDEQQRANEFEDFMHDLIFRRQVNSSRSQRLRRDGVYDDETMLMTVSPRYGNGDLDPFDLTDPKTMTLSSSLDVNEDDYEFGGDDRDDDDDSGYTTAYGVQLSRSRRSLSSVGDESKGLPSDLLSSPEAAVSCPTGEKTEDGDHKLIRLCQWVRGHELVVDQLRHFSKYSVEVHACIAERDTDKELSTLQACTLQTERSDHVMNRVSMCCSPSHQAAGRTRMLRGADDIDSASVSVHQTLRRRPKPPPLPTSSTPAATTTAQKPVADHQALSSARPTFDPSSPVTSETATTSAPKTSMPTTPLPLTTTPAPVATLMLAHDVLQDVPLIAPAAGAVGAAEDSGEEGIADGGVFVRWQPPADPNALIVSYMLEYKRDVDGANPITICVSHAEYNSTKGRVLHGLGTGNYLFRVKATSQAGAGNWTKPVLFFVQDASGRPQHTSLVISLAIIIFLLLICAVAIIYIYARRRLSKEIPDAVLYASMNPEYLSSSYEPDEWEVSRDKVKLLHELGQGSFGMVYQGIVFDLNGIPETECAVKTVNEGAHVHERNEFLQEASTMKRFDAYHVVKLLGVVSKGQPYVIMELMSNGDLKSYLRSHRPDEEEPPKGDPPTLRQVLQMAAEIADGMAYLASLKYVHRDLAARNCMVSADLTVKIGDFGMTRDIYETDYYRKGGKGLLPVRWMSPESLKDGVFTAQGDVWSYGIVLWEMVTLAMMPYQGLTNEQALKFVISRHIMERPENCPDKLYEIMKQCWQYNPKMRPKFDDIVEMLLDDAHERFHQLSYYTTSRSRRALGKDESLDEPRPGTSGEGTPLMPPTTAAAAGASGAAMSGGGTSGAGTSGGGVIPHHHLSLNTSYSKGNSSLGATKVLGIAPSSLRDQHSRFTLGRPTSSCVDAGSSAQADYKATGGVCFPSASGNTLKSSFDGNDSITARYDNGLDTTSADWVSPQIVHQWSGRQGTAPNVCSNGAGSAGFDVDEESSLYISDDVISDGDADDDDKRRIGIRNSNARSIAAVGCDSANKRDWRTSRERLPTCQLPLASMSEGANQQAQRKRGLTSQLQPYLLQPPQAEVSRNGRAGTRRRLHAATAAAASMMVAAISAASSPAASALSLQRRHHSGNAGVPSGVPTTASTTAGGGCGDGSVKRKNGVSLPPNVPLLGPDGQAARAPDDEDDDDENGFSETDCIDANGDSGVGFAASGQETTNSSDFRSSGRPLPTAKLEFSAPDTTSWNNSSLMRVPERQQALPFQSNQVSTAANVLATCYGAGGNIRPRVAEGFGINRTVGNNTGTMNGCKTFSTSGHNGSDTINDSGDVTVVGHERNGQLGAIAVAGASDNAVRSRSYQHTAPLPANVGVTPSTPAAVPTAPSTMLGPGAHSSSATGLTGVLTSTAAGGTAGAPNGRVYLSLNATSNNRTTAC